MSKRRAEAKTPGFFTGKIRHWLDKADISQENRYFFNMINYSAVVAFFIHALFLFVFILLRLKTLALCNIGSLFCYFSCYIMNRKGHQNIANALILAGNMIHTAAAVVFLGRQSGFDVYIIISTILVCLSPGGEGWLLKGLSVLGLCAVYLGLNIYGEVFPPLVHIDPGFQRTFFYGNSAVMFLSAVMLVHYYRLTAQRVEKQLYQDNRQLDLLASTDPLTKLLNRRGMTRIIQNEMGRAGQTTQQFTILFADIDDFKRINDQYGYECGDKVLIDLADFLRKSLREEDRIARWGGEEFLIILSGTDAKKGWAIAERLKSRIAEHLFHYKYWSFSVTVTFGVTAFDGTEDVMSCINNADTALRLGKAQGKNRVVCR
jgi:diguanylate cyclase (GGDEF)-like protein